MESNMPTILALETAFNACSVCLVNNGSKELIHRHAPRKQTQMILPMIDELLQKTNKKLAEVDYIAFNRGPGSFSGIRINTAVTQALAYAHDIQCVPVSGLQAQAQMVFTHHPQLDAVTIINDAKMQELYVANYIKDDVTQYAKLLGDEALLPTEFNQQELIKNPHIFGDGVHLLQNQDTHNVIDDTSIELTAEHIAMVAENIITAKESVHAMNAQPVYLRNNAWKTVEQQNKKTSI